MSTNFVNLDAMIKREDFLVAEDPADFEQTDTIPVVFLKPGFFYSRLRKPDFQRETSSWPPAKVADLVKSFVTGDLVPAVILWQPSNSKYIFVIDGAHRLSALIAWVNDDYGDKSISRAYFENSIEAEQEKAADVTRKLVDKHVGSYTAHEKASEFPDTTKPEILAQASRLASLAIRVQWVRGNADKAETSFFKINQEATPIDPTEIQILEARKTPMAMSARAILRAGTGHRYWSDFSKERQAGIEGVGKEIYNTLFRPPLKLPIKTLDLPVAGKAYSSYALPLIFDFAKLVNGDISLKPDETDKKKRKPKKTDEEKKAELAALADLDGARTLQYLGRVRDAAYRISGTDSSSLGLHPAVYFYSASGRHQPTAFLAIAGFVKELENRNRLKLFTLHRSEFEEFQLANKDFVNQIVVKQGGGLKPFYRLKEFYHFVLNALEKNLTQAGIIAALEKDLRFSFLKARPSQDPETKTPDFKGSTKSAVYLRDALNAPRERCQVCGARMHVNSIHIDHIVKKEDGGLGILDNGQLAHPFCDSTVKN